MGDIVPAYVPVTGDVLDPAALAGNIANTTPDVSLYRGINSNLTDDNFHIDMLVQPEHVRPGETHREETDHGLETLDYFDDAFERYTAAEAVSGITLSDFDVPIANCGTKLWLPYDCSGVLYNLNLFYTVFRMREQAQGASAGARTGPEIYLAMYIDGDYVDHTLRRCPITYQGDFGAGDSLHPWPMEFCLTEHYEVNHLAITGAETAKCDRGWHDVQMHFYMPPTTGWESFKPPFHTSLFEANIDYKMHHRLRAGIRGGRILGLL